MTAATMKYPYPDDMTRCGGMNISTQLVCIERETCMRYEAEKNDTQEKKALYYRGIKSEWDMRRGDSVMCVSKIEAAQ